MLLGFKFTQDNYSISLSQTYYINNLLHKFHLSDANTVNMPMDPNINLDINKRLSEITRGQGEITNHGCDAYWIFNISGTWNETRYYLCSQQTSTIQPESSSEALDSG